jgi:large subunit ribosomal protein L6
MSKIGKQPVIIPEGVSVEISKNDIVVSGTKGKCIVNKNKGVIIQKEEDKVTFSLEKNDVQSRSSWGTMRALVANAVTGVSEGFQKTLVIDGVGFKVAQKGSGISLSLGYSHIIEYEPPDGVTVEIEKDGVIKVSGIDKAIVGEVSANIRAFRKPEPYKGKGIRYSDEVIKRKVGKKAGSTAT